VIVKDEIVMDDATHTYWDRDGRRVLGFTELMSHHGYLGGFASEDALKRGRNVHLAIHYYEKGLLGIGPGLDIDALSPRIKPYFESYLGFKELTKWKLLMTEVMVYDPSVRLASTLDGVWDTGDGLAIIDDKTGPVHRWVGYQTAAQENGIEDKKRKYRRYGLMLCDDGRPGVLRQFEDVNDNARVRMFASVFYTKVNDGVLKWALTKESMDQQRREEYGVDLFTGSQQQAI